MRILIEISESNNAEVVVTPPQHASAAAQPVARNGGGAGGDLSMPELAMVPPVLRPEVVPGVVPDLNIETFDAGPAPGHESAGIKGVAEAGFGGEHQSLHASASAPGKVSARSRAKKATTKSAARKRSRSDKTK